tara:strand:- start:54 stop:239 length:186 start_codon:yes stop_codon:yes gene_type:complete
MMNLFGKKKNLTPQQKANQKKGILKTEEASAQETKRILLDKQRKNQFLKERREMNKVVDES